MTRLLTANGVDVSTFKSRPLTAQHVREADLVLTLTAAHRAEVLEHEPVALRPRSRSASGRGSRRSCPRSHRHG